MAGGLASGAHLGGIGESLAALWYESKGGFVLARNWRPSGSWRGELDLVIKLGAQAAFCEVKTRTQGRFGDPAEAVNPEKSARLKKLAALWLQQSGSGSGGRRGFASFRFDVACVFLGAAGIEAAKLGRGERVELPGNEAGGLTWGIVDVLEGAL